MVVAFIGQLVTHRSRQKIKTARKKRSTTLVVERFLVINKDYLDEDEAELELDDR